MVTRQVHQVRQNDLGKALQAIAAEAVASDGLERERASRIGSEILQLFAAKVKAGPRGPVCRSSTVIRASLVVPDKINANASAAITIYGSGFSAASGVSFAPQRGETKMSTQFQVIDDTRMMVVPPLGIGMTNHPGDETLVNVSVTSPGGTSDLAQIHADTPPTMASSLPMDLLPGDWFVAGADAKSKDRNGFLINPVWQQQINYDACHAALGDALTTCCRGTATDYGGTSSLIGECQQFTANARTRNTVTMDHSHRCDELNFDAVNYVAGDPPLNVGLNLLGYPWGAEPAPVPVHVNWTDATYEGCLYWEEWSAYGGANPVVPDYDYDFGLVTRNLSGVSPANERLAPPYCQNASYGSCDPTKDPKCQCWNCSPPSGIGSCDPHKSQGGKCSCTLCGEWTEPPVCDPKTDPNGCYCPVAPNALHVEIDEREVSWAMQSAGGWWRTFNDQAHQNGAAASVHGNYAVVSGLVGLDCQHGCKTELHPVYAIAIKESTDPSNSETYAILARTSGGEGVCGEHQHPLTQTPGPYTLSVHIPWRPGASKVTWPGALTALAQNVDAANVVISSVVGDGVYVTIPFTQPTTTTTTYDKKLTVTVPTQQIMLFELSLNWSGGFPRDICDNLPRTSPNVVNNSNEREERLVATIKTSVSHLSPAQQQAIRTRLPDTHYSYPALKPQRVTLRSAPLPPGHGSSRLYFVPDPIRGAQDAAFRKAMQEIAKPPKP
jgi:hypothetical protein